VVENIIITPKPNTAQPPQHPRPVLKNHLPSPGRFLSNGMDPSAHPALPFIQRYPGRGGEALGEVVRRREPRDAAANDCHLRRRFSPVVRGRGRVSACGMVSVSLRTSTRSARRCGAESGGLARREATCPELRQGSWPRHFHSAIGQQRSRFGRTRDYSENPR
jgi:hypothetical protein